MSSHAVLGLIGAISLSISLGAVAASPAPLVLEHRFARPDTVKGHFDHFEVDTTGKRPAETFALPYLELGVNTHSSAIFNLLPKFALDFYAAVRRRDHAAVNAGLRAFALPYIAIRRREPICP